jgi:aminoglycoside phosphotransferase (APT) family kinase protein
VHGDLYALHLIVDPAGRPAGVIDWGDVHYGSPCLDLAIAFGYFPEEQLSAFEAEYGALSGEKRLASAFRAFCHGLSLLAFAADQGKLSLKEQTLASILASKAWLKKLN